MATFQGDRFLDAQLAQHRRAIELYGQDELASGIEPRRVTPAIAADFALELAKWWMGVAPNCVRRALEGADPDHPWLVVTNAAESTTWIHKAMAEATIDKLRAGELADDEAMRVIGSRSPLAASILEGVAEMHFAIKIGYWDFGPFGRTGTMGRPVMSALGCRAFWNALRKTASGCGGSTASVTAEEKWQTFKAAANERARELAETAGKAAGFVAATVGQSIGAGVGGFFGELGIVQTALFAGGVFLAWKVI